MPELSIVIPTRNRAAFLERCLVSACSQNLAPQRYEICVVNNGSTDETADIVHAVAKLYADHHLFIVDEPAVGLSAARNRGLSATTAPLIGFLDDDATAPAEWASHYIDAFTRHGPQTAAVGGEIVPLWEAPKPEWLTPGMEVLLSAQTGLGPVERLVQQHESIMEGNACFRRAALEQAGRFPISLGRVGNNLISGENNVCVVMQQQGGTIWFHPDILIYHFIHANRLNEAWLRKRYFWHGVTDYAARLYFSKAGIPVVESLPINLPLQTSDWQFLQGQQTADFPDNLAKFRALGFMLALTDLISLEGR